MEEIGPLFLCMKTKSKDEKGDELCSEYDLANLLREGVRGEYAKRYERGTNLRLAVAGRGEGFPASAEAVHRNLAIQALESGVSLNRIAGVKLSR